MPSSQTAAVPITLGTEGSSDVLPVLTTPFGRSPPPPSLMAARAFAASRTALRAKVMRSGQVRATLLCATISCLLHVEDLQLHTAKLVDT